MALHKNLTGEDAVHPFAIIAAADPGAIGAGKAWLDTSSAPHTLRYRNAANTGWEGIIGEGAVSQAELDAVEQASIDADALLDARVAALEDEIGGGAPAFTALADGATITWATGGKPVSNAKVTLGGSRALDITGAVNGASGELRVTQDATGGRTLTLPANSKVVNAPLALATDPGALTILAWSFDGTTYVWTYGTAA